MEHLVSISCMTAVLRSVAVMSSSLREEALSHSASCTWGRRRGRRRGVGMTVTMMLALLVMIIMIRRRTPALPPDQSVAA